MDERGLIKHPGSNLRRGDDLPVVDSVDVFKQKLIALLIPDGITNGQERAYLTSKQVEIGLQRQRTTPSAVAAGLIALKNHLRQQNLAEQPVPLEFGMLRGTNASWYEIWKLPTGLSVAAADYRPFVDEQELTRAELLLLRGLLMDRPQPTKKVWEALEDVCGYPINERLFDRRLKDLEGLVLQEDPPMELVRSRLYEKSARRIAKALSIQPR